MEKKKKSANYIIPATFFQALSPAVKEIAKPIQKKVEVIQPKNEEPKAVTPKLVLKSTERRSLSLSLKSIHQKKDIEKKVEDENFDDHPKEIFTEEFLQKLWKEHANLLQKKGEKSMASIIRTALPILNKNFKVAFTVPNSLMQDQFHKGRPKLLKFLREELNNYGITIETKVNETIEKKFAYTPQEKFNKMKEMNPLLEKLRQTFELDL